jgi:hypothetical protein
MSSTLRNRPQRHHDARADYCGCPKCSTARAEAAHRQHLADAEAARFIPVDRLYRWIRRAAR